MYRISVTTLEKFRRFTVEASPYDTEAALIETIKGIFLGNDKTRTGEAFHGLIEGEYSSEANGFLSKGILFTPTQARPAFEFKKLHPSMIHEINVRKVYLIPGHEIMITGRMDGLEGIQIRDTKTKFRSIDMQEYADSYQWRFYLDMVELDVFYYDVFEVKGFEALPLRPDVQFCDPETLCLYRYDSMQEDCLTLLNDFMKYIHDRNFYHLLKQVNETAIL